MQLTEERDEKFLTVKVEAPEERILRYLEKNILKDNAFTAEYLKNCIADAYGRLIAPAIEREIRSEPYRDGRGWSNQSVWKES